MKVKPIAVDRLAENRKPVGRLDSAASAMRADRAGAAGGRRSQSPSRRVPLARAIAKVGLSRVRRVAATLFHLVLGHDPWVATIAGPASNCIARPACLCWALVRLRTCGGWAPRRHPLRVWYLSIAACTAALLCWPAVAYFAAASA